MFYVIQLTVRVNQLIYIALFPLPWRWFQKIIHIHEDNEKFFPLKFYFSIVLGCCKNPLMFLLYNCAIKPGSREAKSGRKSGKKKLFCMLSGLPHIRIFIR